MSEVCPVTSTSAWRACRIWSPACISSSKAWLTVRARVNWANPRLWSRILLTRPVRRATSALWLPLPATLVGSTPVRALLISSSPFMASSPSSKVKNCSIIFLLFILLMTFMASKTKPITTAIKKAAINGKSGEARIASIIFWSP